jgi:hypothetical protein
MTGISLRLVAMAFGLLLAFCADGLGQTPQLPPKTKIDIKTGTNTNLGKAKAIIVGNILDPYGAVVVGASVTVQLNPNEKAVSVTSDEEGSFVVPLAAAGVYTVIINARGFITYTARDLKIDENSRAEMSVALEIDTRPRQEFFVVTAV